VQSNDISSLGVLFIDNCMVVGIDLAFNRMVVMVWHIVCHSVWYHYLWVIQRLSNHQKASLKLIDNKIMTGFGSKKSFF